MSAPGEPVVEPSDPIVEPTTIPIATSSEPSAPADYRLGLPTDLRGNPTLEKLDTVEKLALEHINVQKMIGTEKIERPKEDWTDDQYSEFFSKIGRPEKAEDYDLDGIERPEDLPWDDGFQEKMIGVMHGAGLSQSQVKKMLSGYIDLVGGDFESMRTNVDNNRESGVQDLRNEWGKSFEANVDLAKRALMAGAGEGFDELASIELAGGGKLGDHPSIIRAFATLGGKMNEHGLVGAQSSRATLSPSEAGAERNKLMSDQDFLKSYLDEGHLEHAASVKRISDLTAAEIG